MGDAAGDRLSDAGSIPARSTKKSLLELIWPKNSDWFEEVSINVDLQRRSASEKFDADFFSAF